MRVAIFSDVHGNLTALEAVLAHIKQQSPDLVLFAGDLCKGGARPAACVDLLRSEAISAIHGNTDLELSNKPLLSDPPNVEESVRTAMADTLTEWTWGALDADRRAYLRTLPFHRRVSPSNRYQDDIFVVHANPKNVDDHIYPSLSRQRELFGEVQQEDDDRALTELLEDLGSGILAFGHLHIPDVRDWNSLKLVNISSVSQPIDGDTRSKYGLFTWENGGWHIEHQYVEYDIDAEVEQLSIIQPPGWEELAKNLRTARRD